jgi:hypothetical protein
MSLTIALAAALAIAPGRTSELALSNVRLTYRDFGSTRADARYLPGDVFFLSFDMDGLKINDDGEVGYSMGMDMLDKVGKAVFSAPPGQSRVQLPLGGTKLPGNVYIPISQDMPPGTYTCKVTIADASAPKVTKIIEQKFEVLPKDFGLVALYVARDEKGMFASGMSGVAGQTVYVHFGLANFGRDAAKKPDAAVELRVFDASGQVTTKKPIVGVVPRELPERDQFVPCVFPLALSRDGAFKVEIRAADKVTGKTTTLTFPITVYPASK